MEFLYVDEDWTKIETDYLVNLCRQYGLNFHVIADRYSFGSSEDQQHASNAISSSETALETASIFKRRSLVEIKTRYNELCKRLVNFKHLADPFYDPEKDLKRKELLNKILYERDAAYLQEEASVLAAISNIIHAQISESPIMHEDGSPIYSLEWFQRRRNQYIELYAGDLFAFIDGISQAEWMRKNVATSTSLTAGSHQAYSSTPHSKKTSALKTSAPPASASTTSTPRNSSSATSTSHTSEFTVPKKEKVWIGPFPRSTKLKPLRTGISKHVEKILFEEFGLPVKPIIPIASIQDAYDDIRGLALMLVDERKLLDRLEAQARPYK